MSTELGNNITSIKIDEDQNYALTRITQTKAEVVVKRSNHNVIVRELAISWNPTIRKEKIKILNFKDKPCQEKFKEETSKDNYLSSVFNENESLNTQTNIFLKRLNKVCHKVFKIIKVTNKREKEHE